MAMRRRDFVLGSLAASLAANTGVSQSVVSRMFSSRRSSAPLTGVRVGNPVRLAENSGDTWIAAWAGDGNLYSPSNDTKGFHKACSSNLAFNLLEGTDPLQLRGTTVNPMHEYGRDTQLGADGCTWKSSGCIWIDGALYWLVARHKYGEQSGDPWKRQTAQNASIIRSTDLGKSWTRTAQQNYDAPMFPGRRFATPYFIQYGYGHRTVTEDNASNYVYATANNGFWDCGDDVVLGRVARSKIALLNERSWEFYTGGDGMKNAAWSPNMNDARTLLAHPRRFGMTGAIYLPSHRRYFMTGWYYPAGGGKMKGACVHTVWDFYESPHPWGPWTQIDSYASTPAGWYSPEVSPRFQAGNRIVALTAGNWNDADSYRLTVVPLELAT
jgi:hypothetical protein